MKTLATSLLLLSLGLTGCGKRQTAKIADVTKPATLTLAPAPGQGTSVHALTLRIHGKIDGSALMWRDQQTNRFTGKFEWLRSGDYYATNCVVGYLPVGVRSGQISIEYEFHSID